MRKTVTPRDVATLLEDAPEGVRVLSLDCFDTLIWRATNLPQDVFAEFDYPGGGIEPRVQAEQEARRLRLRRDGLSEVSIEEIHAHLPGDSDAGVARELALEARHCFAFAPTVALIADAKARGLKIIIVSDTYLSRSQLHGLIAAVGGEELVGMIDRIFCSSEYGRSKGGGLFADVLREIGEPAKAILHVGDNPDADGVAAEAAGLNAVHIRQFDEATANILRLEANAAVMLDPMTRVSQPVIQLHRAPLAMQERSDPAWHLGHDIVGPVLDAFSRWLKAEVAALAAETGRPVKPLFLLRDGFLPHAMYEAIGGKCACVAISRFAARQASFADRGAVERYLDEESTERVDALAAQLGLTPAEAAKIGGTNAAFRRNIFAPDALSRIFRRSAAYAKRLIAHLRREARIADGDIVMLVDLGYRGTVQDLAAPVLEDRLGVTVTGRYLLLSNSNVDPDRKRGLFDSRHYDHRLLRALCSQIAIIEQVCTSSAGSVLDYADNGRAKYRATRVDKAQSETRARIQAGAIAFARSGDAAFHRPPAADQSDARRRMALAILGRLLFMPQPDEVAIFSRFEHDVNLGTDDLVGMVDQEGARRELRRHGMAYVRRVDRMFLSGELQAHGLPVSLSWLSANRFGLDLRLADFAVEKLPVAVLLAAGGEQIVQSLTASPTHDGFYVLNIPVGAAKFDAGVQIGAFGQVVQIDEIAFHRISVFGADKPDIAASPIAASPVFDSMMPLAEGLWRCDENSLLFVPPPRAAVDEPLVLSIVFRPIVKQAQSAAPRGDADARSVAPRDEAHAALLVN
ncbi:HAD family hydrolase [uncultured Sphingomonas sp.]|uniref:HAD family hydrolase n=1 Tax=uncultured Sphingomonas sp. TaxID=158754 RepID=UPI00261962D2|nr:HAD family hydrolase [uncultured Sphingomonas sp.]